MDDAPWQHVLRAAVRDPDELCRRLELPPEWLEGARRAAASFPVFVPQPYLDRIRRGDPADPLLRQVLPVGDELTDQPGFSADPVGDLAVRSLPGLLQKYDGRSLMITTGACAVHCRYCFRRHYPYHESPRSVDDWQPALDRLRADESIEEVLLSGGDPLTLVDSTLAQLAARLAEIPHLRRLRVHSRVPVVIPQRVTNELIGWLRGTRLTPFMVVHVNHPAEIDDAVELALGRLIDAGIPVLNQAVLLRGVNDDPDVLFSLSRRLIDCRVIPYYVNQLDRVAGAAHFEVPRSRGLELLSHLPPRLPGYAIPRYVEDLGSHSHKNVITR